MAFLLGDPDALFFSWGPGRDLTQGDRNVLSTQPSLLCLAQHGLGDPAQGPRRLQPSSVEFKAELPPWDHHSACVTFLSVKVGVNNTRHKELS